MCQNFILSMANILLYKQTTFGLSISPYTIWIYQFVHLLMDTSVVPTCWLLWIMLWTLEYKDPFESLFAILVGVYLGVELLGYRVILCQAFWGRKLTYTITEITLVGIYFREVIADAPRELLIRLLIISTVSNIEKIETHQMINDIE